jgi:SWI/SNF related-matrix-associated actin-dependent regulator of chromatin subfamily C
VVLKHKYEQKIPKLDLTLFGKKNQILELCAQIETCLAENGRLLFPTCFFREDLFAGAENSALLTRLKELVRKHKGTITDNMDEADHVVYPPSFEEIADVTNGANHWVKVLRKRAKDSILVHRLFTPDSYDEWINSIDVDDELTGLNDSGSDMGGEVWEVTANWVLDTDLYNEWMNQGDYEVDSEQTVS